MMNEVLLAIIQSITEFLPISSSGHLAIFSNIFLKTDLFLITILHIASLFAVLVFVRKELKDLLKFDNNSKKLFGYIIIATIPGALVGFFLKEYIEFSFNSFLFLGFGFLFTGTVLFFTKFSNDVRKSDLSFWNCLFIGLMQAIALFPGVSRSGMTVSSGLFSGIDREKAVKFSFLLFIPLAIGAFLLEFKDFYYGGLNLSTPLYIILISFFICFIFSFIFLNLLFYIVKRKKFWLFSLYCWIIGILCLSLYVLNNFF